MPYGLFTFGILWPTPVQDSFHRLYFFLGPDVGSQPKPGGKMTKTDRLGWHKYRFFFVDQADDAKDNSLKNTWCYLITHHYAPNVESHTLGDQLCALATFGQLWPHQVREFIFFPEAYGEAKK